MSSAKRWAALDADLMILRIGVQHAGLRFDRRCFHFSFGGFAHWAASGARYCELFEKAEIGQEISGVKHGPVRKSKDTLISPLHCE